MSSPLPAAAAGAAHGAGASLPFGTYRAWFDAFAGVPFASCNPAGANCIAYAAISSDVGIAAFLAQQSPVATPGRLPYENALIVYNEGTTGYGTGRDFLDFTGSERPLTAAESANYGSLVQPTRGPAIQIPMLGAPIAIAFNAAGLNINHPVPTGSKLATGGSSGLWLSRRAYCGIFTGAITNWNDPVLTADNGGLALTVSLPIKVYRRTDATGTTFLLSRHLATVCNGTADKTTGHPAGSLATWSGGIGTTVTWPATFLAAAGTQGVAAAVLANTGAITYAAPDYTQQSPTPVISPAPVAANLQNQADYNSGGLISGDIPRPPAPTYTTTALAGFVPPATDTAATWGDAIDTAMMRNPTGATAYPIAGFSLLNLYGCYTTAAKASLLKGFIAAYAGGALPAAQPGFVPLSSPIRTRINSWVSTAITTC